MVVLNDLVFVLLAIKVTCYWHRTQGSGEYTASDYNCTERKWCNYNQIALPLRALTDNFEYVKKQIFGIVAT